MDLVWTWLGRVADVASLVAFPASVYAAWKLKRMGARFAFHMRGLRTLDLIDDRAERIRGLLLQAPGHNLKELKSLLIECLAQVETIRSGVDGPAAKAARKIAVLIKEMNSTTMSEEDVTTVMWKALDQINVFRILARGLHSDRQIGASNDSR